MTNPKQNSSHSSGGRRRSARRGESQGNVDGGSSQESVHPDMSTSAHRGRGRGVRNVQTNRSGTGGNAENVQNVESSEGGNAANVQNVESSQGGNAENVQNVESNEGGKADTVQNVVREGGERSNVQNVESNQGGNSENVLSAERKRIVQTQEDEEIRRSIAEALSPKAARDALPTAREIGRAMGFEFDEEGIITYVPGEGKVQKGKGGNTGQEQSKPKALSMQEQMALE